MFAGSHYDTLCDLQAAKFNVQRDVPASGIPTLLCNRCPRFPTA